MLKINTKYIFITSIVIFCLAIISVFFAYKEIRSKIDIVKQYRAQETKNKNEDFGFKLKKQLDVLSNQEKVLYKAFIDSNAIVDFITKIETLGMNSGVVVTVEKMERGTLKTISSNISVQPINFNLKIEGSLDDIVNFVDTINSFEQKMTLKEFKLYTMDEKTLLYSARIIYQGLAITYE